MIGKTPDGTIVVRAPRYMVNEKAALVQDVHAVCHEAIANIVFNAEYKRGVVCYLSDSPRVPSGYRHYLV